MNPLTVKLYAAGAAATVAVSFGAGWQVRAWRCDAEIADIRQEIVDATERQRLRFDKGAQGAETIRDQTDTRTIEYRTTIQREYVNVEVPASCAPLPATDSRLRAAIDATNRATTGKPTPAMPDTAEPS